MSKTTSGRSSLSESYQGRSSETSLPASMKSHFSKQSVGAKSLTSSPSTVAFTVDNVRHFLSEHVLFKNLNEEVLASITKTLQFRMVPDKQFIVRKGEEGKAMFLIIKGEVEVISDDGK